VKPITWPSAGAEAVVNHDGRTRSERHGRRAAELRGSERLHEQEPRTAQCRIGEGESDGADDVTEAHGWLDVRRRFIDKRAHHVAQRRVLIADEFAGGAAIRVQNDALVQPRPERIDREDGQTLGDAVFVERLADDGAVPAHARVAHGRDHDSIDARELHGG